MQDPQIRKSLEIIYNYLSVSDPLEKADAIFAAGGATISPAIKTAEIFKQGWANKIFITARRGTFSNPTWVEDEAVVYKKELLKLGVPEEAIFIDPISTSSLEEADDSIYLMKQNGVDPKVVIIVDRPIHQRREWATFEGVQSGFGIKFINCPADEMLEYTQETLDRLVMEMVRLEIYTLQGTLAKQKFPQQVKLAYELLSSKANLDI